MRALMARQSFVWSDIMRFQQQHLGRRGTVVPVVAICLVGIVGMVALAIDVGMVAVARNQAQNAADSAAMAGARTITGDSTNSYNVDNAPTNAVKAAVANSILGATIGGDPATNWNPTDPALLAQVHPSADSYATGDIKVDVGAYAYIYNDSTPASEGFQIQFPRASTSEPYSAVKVTITHSSNFAFGRIFGISSFNANAYATAVHRPRDVVVVVDLSGSMRFQSLPGIPYSGARTTSMQPDVYPKFGHYSNTASAALYGNTSIATGGGEMYDPTNLTMTTNSGPPIVNDFYQNASGVTPSSANYAFSRWSDSYDVTPGGDNYPAKYNTSTTPITYAQTVNDWKNYGGVRNVTFETDATLGGYGSSFNGYTAGPGYWGKTFFIWPPDPRGATSTDMSVAANQANNGAKDWRQRFFIKVKTSTSAMTPLDDNTLIWNSDGTFRAPHTNTTVTEVDPSTRKSTNVTYIKRINYAAIFSWLRSSPKPLPYILRAGRIRYYDSMPDPSTDTGINDRLWKNQTGTTDNEHFWRNYIDFVLGVQVNGMSGSYVTYSNSNGTRYAQMIGNGDTYTWGTFQVKQKPNATSQSSYITGVQANGAIASGATTIPLTSISTWPVVGDWMYISSGGNVYYYKVTAVNSGGGNVTIDTGLKTNAATGDAVRFRRDPPFMDYDDNPQRPKHHYWFGAQTMLDYLGNYNMDTFLWPGNCHEAQAWACKVGIQTAIDDIKSNHPSDFIGMCYFSSPCYSRGGSGQYNVPVVPLGRNYDQLKASLWFPPSTITGGATEIGMYDPDMNNVPRAHGGTAPGMGFMLAYNLLSSSTTVRGYPQPQTNYRGVVGGLGRKGASRLIIFETDGAPNTAATATLAGTGSNSYYPIRLYNPGNYNDTNNVEWPSNPGFSTSAVYTVVQQITALDTANPPGYSTTRKPVLIYAIGYGSLFDPANAGTSQNTGLTFLQTVQYYGGTSADTNYANFPSNQRIYGPSDTSVGGRIDRMQKAFSSIMQSGVQVSLIQ